ncbi:Arc family DNA-binding protein [Commensalibacter melissae]|uniref:Arc family DNA-binding protein n=1 Tax=Commensalibacter melissae TaxID=2070537 RepID=UPI000EFBCBDF|nr:Arc family DNA-binding protein [Commensalibacter melissae]AYN86302.1 Arc family DNA-binding protein [Commensalibacter melissae]
MSEKKKIYRYTLRLNDDFHKMLEKRALENNRAMNGEIMEILRHEFNKSKLKDSDKYEIMASFLEKFLKTKYNL